MLPEMNPGSLLKGIAIIIVICLVVMHFEGETSDASYNSGYNDGYEEGYDKGYFDALEEYGIEK